MPFFILEHLSKKKDLCLFLEIGMKILLRNCIFQE